MPARRLAQTARVHPRRALVAAVLVVAVAAAALLVVNSFSRAETVETGNTAAHGATVLRYAVKSRYVDATMPQVAAVPAGTPRRRPLLVFLHGRGGGLQESNANEAFFKALAALGSSAPAVVFPSGADHSYWHKRSSGDWPRYVLDEVIPAAVRRLHANPRRVAIGGISMGGYGAYEIAALRPHRFCAVGGHSAAIWTAAGDSAAGAFDDAQDFTAHDVVALARRNGRGAWRGTKLWLDGGSKDPFHEEISRSPKRSRRRSTSGPAVTTRTTGKPTTTTTSGSTPAHSPRADRGR
jgi:poly(3-hydroxybutyrate) depolymerase